MGKTQSQKLRENKNQHSLKNIESKEMDVKIVNIVKKIQKDLKNNYGIEIYHIDKIYNREIEDICEADREDYLCKSSTYIKPDGGLLYIIINGVKKYILFSEQKRQGTNDKRLLEGKPVQSNGNAIERAPKNALGSGDSIFGDEDINPIVYFIQGCDFYDPESNIKDRVITMSRYNALNQINLFWRKRQKHVSVAGSYFVRGHSMHEAPGTSDWTYNEMYDIMYEIASRSIEHYLEKYNK
jgi:hypothetical protein